MKYNIFFIIFFSFANFIFSANQEPNIAAINKFLKTTQTYNNNFNRLLEGEERIDFIRKTLQWSQRLEEQNNVNLIKNLQKTSALAKIIYKFKNELINSNILNEQTHRELAIQCKDNLIALINPDDEDFPFHKNIIRYKAYSLIWWAQINIKIINGNAAESWGNLVRAEDYYETSIAKLWQLHLILRSRYSPQNNQELDLEYARMMYNKLTPNQVNNQPHREAVNPAVLNELAIVLQNAEENNPLIPELEVVEVNEQPNQMMLIANILNEEIQDNNPQVNGEIVNNTEPINFITPDSMRNNENRQMLDDLGQELQNREAEHNREIQILAAIEEIEQEVGNIENLEQYLNGEQNNNTEEDSETEEENDECIETVIYRNTTELKEEFNVEEKEWLKKIDINKIKIVSNTIKQMLAENRVSLKKHEKTLLKNELNISHCQLSHLIGILRKKHDIKTVEFDDDKKLVIANAIEKMIKEKRVYLTTKEREELENKLNISNWQLSHLITLERKKLDNQIKDIKNIKLECNYDIELINELKKHIDDLIKMSGYQMPKGVKNSLKEKYKISEGDITKLIKKLRAEAGIKRKTGLERYSDKQVEVVRKAVIEIINKGNKTLDKNQKQSLIKELNLKESELTNLISLIRKEQNFNEQSNIIDEANKKKILDILEKKRLNNERKIFTKVEKESLQKDLNLDIHKINNIIIEANRELDKKNQNNKRTEPLKPRKSTASKKQKK